MAFVVSIVSTDTIKPSSPTPSHLLTFDFSLVDQIAPPLYIPILLFYDNKNKVESSEICRRLKTSLSETLTSYYPFAGRVNGNTSVECNDEGATFIEARVNAPLSDVMVHPNIIQALEQLIPGEPHFDEVSGTGSKVLLAIQLNLFDCGGIVIGVSLSHKIADGFSMATFINAWAAKASNSNQLIHPISKSSSLFPKIDSFPSLPPHRGVVTKKFVFDSSKIASLRAEVAKGSGVTQPTRVEVVSALIWRCFMELTRKQNKLVKECGAIHAVNFRKRMVSSDQEVGDILGNVCGPTFTQSQELGSKNELYVLVGKLREAIRKIDEEFVTKMQHPGEFIQFMMDGYKGISTGQMEVLMFSSWCRFPWYKAEFGWGNPLWVTTCGTAHKNVVILMDTRCGDGIEASVCLLEEDMAVFDKDQELLPFVSAQTVA